MTFNSTGSIDPDGTIETYQWDFGDGTTGVGATVDHVYDTPGSYMVGMSVVDDLGATGFDSTTADIGSDSPPVVGEVSKVVVEGETLLDNTTVLLQIFLDGGVAINRSGKVAFGGQASTDTVPGVFTQDGLVVKEGDTLLDGTTIVNDLSPLGEVAISVGPSGDRVAFHGQASTNEGATDNDAVFTQAEVVALEGAALGDGTTIVQNIKPEGKVAINFFGVVAFHGDVSDTVGGPTVPAVFTQEGLVVKEGDTLTDGITIVDEINQSGGVGIDFSGNVVFHGRTDGVRAVFTQHGLVAKEDDTLTDSTILDEISVTGGVAISEFGQIAFHGKVGTTDAVLLGNAP